MSAETSEYTAAAFPLATCELIFYGFGRHVQDGAGSNLTSI